MSFELRSKYFTTQLVELAELAEITELKKTIDASARSINRDHLFEGKWEYDQ